MAVYTKITEQEIGYLFQEYNGIEKIEGIAEGVENTNYLVKTQNKNKVLKDEFSISHGEIDPEKASVTVPLLSKQKTLLGAISVSGHVSNFNKTNTLNFLSILKNSRVKLEKQI